MINRKINVLIVSSTDKGKYYLKDVFLDRAFNYQIKMMSDASSCRRELLTNSYDLVVINTPLSDSSGEDLAIHIKSSTNSEIIYIVKNEFFDVMSDKLSELNLMIVAKPIIRSMLTQTIQMAVSLINTKCEYQEKLAKVEEKMEELRYVSKAKCLLISKEHMTEEEAHRFIEKRAMNERTKRSFIAIDIIKRYTT